VKKKLQNKRKLVNKQRKKQKKKEAEKAKKDKKKKEKKDQPYKLELGVVEQFTAPELKCLHPDLVQESKDKLAYLQELDNERRYKLEAKNSLESYLYEVKNRVEDEAQVIDQISTEEQQEVLFEKVRYYIDWIDEDGYDEKGDVYKAKQLEVSELAEPLFFRAKELTARPEAIEMAQKRLRDIRLLVDKWVDTMPQVTESERADVIALVEKAETWLEDKMALQAATESHETPAFTSTEVSQSLKATANLVTRLSRKPKPKPKPVVNITNATNSTSSNRSNTTNVEEEEHEDDVVEEVETLKTDGKGEEDGSSNKDDSVGPDDEL
jgi:hypoxia up-regulated 1